MSIFEAWVIFSILVTCSFIQALIGFAYAVLALPLLSMVIGIHRAVALVAITGPALVLYTSVSMRRYARYRRVIPLCLCSIITVPLGVVILVQWPQNTVMVCLGAVVVTLTLLSQFAKRYSIRVFGTIPVGILFAIISGGLGGAFLTPGLTMVAYFYASEPSPRHAKASIQLYLLVMSLIILGAHVMSGTITRATLVFGLPLMVPILLSARLGLKLSTRVSLPTLSIAVNAAVVAIGLYLIVAHVH